MTSTTKDRVIISLGICLLTVAANADTVYDRQVQQMYIAYYGRAGDPGGVDYWASRLADEGGNWIADLVNAFGNSQEYLDSFGDLTTGELIDNLYQQLYNRDPDPAGLAFYIDLLQGTNDSGFNPDHSQSTLAEIALDIANGSQNEDLTILENKIDVSVYFTDQLVDTGREYQTPDIPLASTILAVVDDTDTSIDARMGYTDDFMDGFGIGTFIVDDNVAGTYATIHGGDCYWVRLSGFSGDFEDIIANDFISEPGAAIVDIRSTDAGFETSEDCGYWIPDGVPLTGSPAEPFDSGTYRVGRDISPGIWTSENLEGDCYWERMSGFGGDFEDIIANDFVGSGSAIVRIEATDVGFLSSRCGTWTQIDDT